MRKSDDQMTLCQGRVMPPFPLSLRLPCYLGDKPPDGGNWVHEIKFDGYRMQAALTAAK